MKACDCANCLKRCQVFYYLKVATSLSDLSNIVFIALQSLAGLFARQRLRLSLTSALAVPMTSLFLISHQAFPVVAARTWNSLPSELTSYKALANI